MSVCPACRAKLDDASINDGRCPECGGRIRAIPQRSLRDPSVQLPGERTEGEVEQQNSGNADQEQTLESASFFGVVSSTEGTIEVSASDTSEAAAKDEEPPLKGPQVTVPLAAEQTIDLGNIDQYF